MIVLSRRPGPPFDGPTRTFKIWMPIRTKTGLNLREHPMARSRRVKRERQATRWFWKTHHMFVLEGYLGPLVISMTRVSPGNPDSDQVVGALKSVRDQLCSQIGRDDRDETIEWRYDKRKGDWGVEVLIQVPENGLKVEK